MRFGPSHGYGTSVALPLDEALIEETGDLAIYA
jgi:hypothetical protein